MNKKEVSLQEAERRRIAEALHDTTIQDMVCLSQQLELILLHMDQDLLQAKLEIAVARRQVKRMITEMRETIYNLRPVMLDDVGWTAALDNLQDQLSKNSADVKVCFDVDAVDTADGVTAISIYRIICEGCQNILKHSNAKSMIVSVKNIGASIQIHICDDGIGIGNPKHICKNHFGLKFMRERVNALSGNMKIFSDSSGTLIKIIIPMERRIEK